MDTLDNIKISARNDTGLSFGTTGGRPLRLALIDDAGAIVAEGEALSTAVFCAVTEAHQNFWIGQGHLTVLKTF